MITIKPFKRMFLLVALLLLGNVSAGQTSGAIHKDNIDIQAAEKAGDKARAAGELKAALASYVAAIQDEPSGTDTDQRLREKVIAVARSMKPPLAFPKEAKRHSARAKVFLKKATDREGYKSAIKEFEAALEKRRGHHAALPHPTSCGTVSRQDLTPFVTPFTLVVRDLSLFMFNK